MTYNTTHYVIVGASAAGMAAAQAIREHDSKGKITVLSDEPDMPYFRPMIPYIITGKKNVDDIAIVGQGPYTAQGIEIRINAKVEKVNPQNKTITIRGGETHGYDKILFATGSRPYIPPDIQGTDEDGVFALRTIRDAVGVKKRLDAAKHAVMLGGGVLNLKAAFALLEKNIEVTLVVNSPEVLSQLMEPEDTTLIRDALDRAGLKIITKCNAKKIIADSTGVTGVILDNGEKLSCEIICIGKGIRQNIEFLQDTPLQIDEGIVVDKYTTCSIPDAYAAGDVAVTFDPITGKRIITGLWTNGVEMGRCAGVNMAIGKTAYTGTFGILNATQIADMPFVSMGIVHTKGKDYEVHTNRTPGTYKKFVFNKEGTKLIGMVLIGDISKAGLYRYVIRENMPVEGIKSAIINHTLHYGCFLEKIS